MGRRQRPSSPNTLVSKYSSRVRGRSDSAASMEPLINDDDDVYLDRIIQQKPKIIFHMQNTDQPE
jgi:hypothetical protein